MLVKANNTSFVGELTVPADKSISHRAIILASIAEGKTYIYNILKSRDLDASINAFRAMGVNISEDKDNLLVRGTGLYGLKEPKDLIDCGNSGTTMRLLSGILAGQKFNSSLIGDSYLSIRPMDRIILPLSLMGGIIKGREDKYPPLVFGAVDKLKGINYKLPMASAQVKSAILLAGLYAEGETSIIEDKVTRDHTENMLAYFGQPIFKKSNKIYMTPKGYLEAREITIPGDISSASYWIVGAILIKGSELIIRNVGVNPTRAGIIKVLKSMGANIRIINKKTINREEVADIYVAYSKLNGITINGDIMGSLIDEVPIIAVAASLADGKTIIRGAEELKYKESNRIKSMVRELKKMGANIIEKKDGMIVEGVESLKAASLFSHNDHRIAMALSIAALKTKGESKIKSYECVNISYPGFFNTLKSLQNNFN